MRRRMPSLSTLTLIIALLTASCADSVPPTARPFGTGAEASKHRDLSAESGVAQDHAEVLRQFTTDERNCQEIRFPTVVPYGPVRALVPSRYTLAFFPAGQIATTRVFVVDYVCDTGVDGHPSRRTSAAILSAAISARDGVPNTNTYLLALGSDNPEFLEHLRLLGLPARFLPQTSQSFTQNADETGRLEMDFVGKELDHFVSAPSVPPPSGPLPSAPSPGVFYYDAALGDITMTYANLLRAPITPASTMTTPTGSIYTDLGVPAVFNGTSRYFTGDWTAVITLTPNP